MQLVWFKQDDSFEKPIGYVQFFPLQYCICDTGSFFYTTFSKFSEQSFDDTVPSLDEAKSLV